MTHLLPPSSPASPTHGDLRPPSDVPCATWWLQHRASYNTGLAGALLSAAVLHVTIRALFDSCPEEDATLFLLFFMPLGTALFIFAANLCYYLGPVSEFLLRPENPSRYRRVCFAIGFYFSILIPLTLPAITAFHVATLKR